MSQLLRIVIGGIQHETSSFTPLPTTHTDFVIVRGVARYTDENVILTSFDRLELIPTFVASASSV